MFRSLRAWLILSHILPLIIVVPLMYVALTYLVETRFLLPRLAEALRSDARYLVEMARLEYLAYGVTGDFKSILLSAEMNPSIRMVYLQPDGTILYSNDPDFLSREGQKVDIPGLSQAKAGEQVVLTQYSFLLGGRETVQVLLPVPGENDQILGVLWMTYYEASINRLFQQLRFLTIAIVVGCLLVGTVLGSVIALNIGNPVRQVTQAILNLAHGESHEVLIEHGPEEIRELVHEVNVLVGRLHSLELARRQLLANLVHELGRPLGALRSAIQALAKGAAEDPQLLGDLTTGMDEETVRLQKILDELAHLHDQVLGSLELNREEVELSEWLPKVLLPWQEAATEKHLIWEARIPAYLPILRIDKVRFAQVIGNLASNAIKYTPSEGAVRISAGQENQQVWIRFNDTGPGISEEEQKKVFLPFYRGDQGRRIKQGMGLGLSIAHDLTIAHGGHLEVESQPSTGSSFTVWLPA
jgi:two-component system sensor histidine kinase BaeS